jgi:transitional endoplasmic reticulum ATPase
LIKSSDLASVYIHGSQEKIGKLFKVAEENAPTVLCFDEFDAFVPNRSAPGSSFVAGEVNEFLSQLNDCSKRGIFVVATTNRPDMIDPAVLRTGRLDKHVYVPMPDHQARKEMFAIYLKGRPCDETIDLDAMADLTDGYIASDIAFIVNDTAMTAAFTHAVITQAMLEQTIRDTKPSVSKESLRNYENIRARMEDTERINALPRMGYKK